MTYLASAGQKGNPNCSKGGVNSASGSADAIASAEISHNVRGGDGSAGPFAPAPVAPDGRRGALSRRWRRRNAPQRRRPRHAARQPQAEEAPYQ